MYKCNPKSHLRQNLVNIATRKTNTRPIINYTLKPSSTVCLMSREIPSGRKQFHFLQFVVLPFTTGHVTWQSSRPRSRLFFPTTNHVVLFVTFSIKIKLRSELLFIRRNCCFVEGLVRERLGKLLSSFVCVVGKLKLDLSGRFVLEFSICSSSSLTITNVRVKFIKQNKLIAKQSKIYNFRKQNRFV